jgi:ADP-ribose pyrophosphatase YjhB (NUDIX family)
MSYRNPTPTVDAVLQHGSKVLMVRRKKDPFKGSLALPGGFVNKGETVEDAVRREAKEETGLEVEPIEILGVYSEPRRDPREHTLSVVFVCITLGGKDGQAGDDAASLEWVDMADIEKKKAEMVFDHALILADYQRWRSGEATTFWSTKRRGSNSG